MKKVTLSLLCATVLIISGPMPAMAASLSYGQVADGLDARKNTKLNINENWKKYKRQEVSWSGTVHEVDGNRDEAKIYLADKSRPLYDGFNIVVVTEDADKAAKIKRGQVVRFQGLIDDYHIHGNSTVIKIRDAHLK